MVTGLAAPAQIVTIAQALFERKLKWSNNLRWECYSMEGKLSLLAVLPTPPDTSAQVPTSP